MRRVFSTKGECTTKKYRPRAKTKAAPERNIAGRRMFAIATQYPRGRSRIFCSSISPPPPRALVRRARDGGERSATRRRAADTEDALGNQMFGGWRMKPMLVSCFRENTHTYILVVITIESTFKNFH
ncbi:hypothetical protein EVAR_83840_1 [Eumeta japonica]|uniref:Uncharacterized protein n=1 Tax=Eumeta variegata TaxID=151549 RepID=A0A4C1UR59_EUMVA|nr:hypothetical protein EVAR_83840_1 [Eumeta japonica]